MTKRRRRIGFDVGGTYVKAGVLEDGEVVEERSFPTPLAEAPEALGRAVADAVDEWSDGDRATVPVGVAVAGLVDPGGRLHAAPNLEPWSGTSVAEIVERELGRPVPVLNDANAFTLAEGRLGAGRNARSVVGVAIGTGVGGGILIDGDLYTGAKGFAGEIGHMPLSLGGPTCACGRRGCLEAWIGTRAIMDRYAALRGEPSPATRSPAEIAERAESGEAAAQASFRETGRLLGIALAGLAHLLDPEVFVVGGGVALAGALLLEPARDAFGANVLHEEDSSASIRGAELGASAGWIGAALVGDTEGERGRST